MAISRAKSISLERDLENFEGFRFAHESVLTESKVEGSINFEFGTCYFRQGGVPRVDGDCLSVEYSGETDHRGFDVRLMLSSKRVSSGFGGEIRLSGWRSINAVSIGYTTADVVTNIKARKVALDEWFFLEFDQDDIAFQLTNAWQKKDAAEVNDIRIYIDGCPGSAGAVIEIRELYTWLQNGQFPSWLNLPPQIETSPPDVMSHLWSYQEHCFRSKQSPHLERECLLAYGKAVVPWPLTDRVPATLHESVSYQYSWHAWHPVMAMLCEYRASLDDIYLNSAQDFANEWLYSSYFNVDANGKYCWYDHGVAERLIAMVMLYEIVSQKTCAPRFLARLRGAIYRHAQLISSEVFYAYTQEYRYHNHAWFQDLSLVATACALPWFPCANNWVRIAVARLEDQLNHLVVVEGDLHVFIENSISYHDGVITVLELFSTLTSSCGASSALLENTLRGMKKFSSFMKYPDGRQASFGDTHRAPNMKDRSVENIQGENDVSHEEGLTVFEKAGYGVIKGIHLDVPYSIIAISSSLSKTHKQEDNASFSLFFDGVEWLIDPGYYSHDYENSIPAYLRSALAHNTIAIPGLPYSVLPHQSSIAGQQDENGSSKVNIVHGCYPGVQIDRSIESNGRALDIRIHDRILVGESVPDLLAHFMFHCGEGVVATACEGGVLLAHELSKSKLFIRSMLDNPIISRGVLSPDPVSVRGVVSHEFMDFADISVVEYQVPLCNTEVMFDISVLKG